MRAKDQLLAAYQKITDLQDQIIRTRSQHTAELDALKSEFQARTADFDRLVWVVDTRAKLGT